MFKRSISHYTLSSNLQSLANYKDYTLLLKNPQSFQDSLKRIELETSLLIDLNPPPSLTLQKLSNLLALISKAKSFFRDLDTENQEIVSKYEGKIAYIEEEQQETERKNHALQDKIRVLNFQLSQMQEEYNQLNEDFNSTMQLLKEQMSSREKSIDEEEDKIYKLNSLIKSLTEDLNNKEEEISDLKDLLKKSSQNPENSFEKLEKKYKSLETLYMDQVQKNNSYLDSVKELESQLKVCEEKLKESENLIKSTKVSKDTSFADASQGSINEADQSTSKVNWRFEATQLQSKLTEYKFELSRQSKQLEDYKFEIIMLHNKTATLQTQLAKKPDPILEINEINEYSDQLKSNDYELTGTLETSAKNPEFELQSMVVESYAELAKNIITKNLVFTEKLSDFEILQKAVETLASIRGVIEKHYEIKREQPDLAKDLEIFIETKLEEKSYENKTVGIRPAAIEINDFQNFTEPSPRFSQRESSSISEIRNKLISKKKVILLHKEQILCLKKQLRETEKMIKVNQNLDVEGLRKTLWTLFEMLPKQDEKIEKEVDACLDVLGFSKEQCVQLKGDRGKRGKFWIFR